MKIKEVVDALERFAPLPLQESFDNAGLQVGLTEAEVSGALLCLDVTEAVVDEAVALGCNLIVSHHPLIFHALKHVTYENDVQRAVAAMPIAGSYRAIDFALSNMTNSHIQKVAVLTQYNARSLNEHLNSSKWWDFGRKQGGL